MSDQSNNLLACLTPPGVGAIATLVIAGPDAWSAARELFRRRGTTKALPETAEVGRFWLGQLGEANRNEVVLTVKEGLPSPRLEIHCHGGVEVVRLLQELFTARGFQSLSWAEFNRRIGQPSWQVEAQEALVRASTARTAAILLDQCHGAFAQARERIQAWLQAGDQASANQALAELRRWVPLGRHLLEPWRVVLAGAPNVGKSSLVNAIAGYARSVVSPIPGTTRDVVTATVALDGWPVQLIDTAGLREQAGALEQLGIARAEDAIVQAELRLWVLDVSQPAQLPPQDSRSWRLVINKVELPATWPASQFPEALLVSAKTGAGVSELCASIARWLVPKAPPPGAAVPFAQTLQQTLAG